MGKIPGNMDGLIGCRGGGAGVSGGGGGGMVVVLVYQSSMY